MTEKKQNESFRKSDMKMERGFISLCAKTSGNSAKRADKTVDFTGYFDYLSGCKLLTLGYDP